MKIEAFILLFLASHSCCYNYNSVVEEVLSSIQTSLASSMKNLIPELFKSLPMTALLNQTKNYHLDENSPLNSTATNINKILLKFQNILTDEITIIPFAIAEPYSNGILVFFGTMNSSFVNLTHFDSKVNIDDSSQSTTSITVNLHINSSSLTGDYELDVSSYDMHLFGVGNYSVIAEGADATFNTSVATFEDGSFSMTDFSMNISLAKVQIFMTNLVDGDSSSQPLLDFIANMIPQQIAVFNDILRDTVNQTVTSFTNNVLAKKFSWRVILWIIQIFADNKH